MDYLSFLSDTEQSITSQRERNKNPIKLLYPDGDQNMSNRKEVNDCYNVRK